MSSTAIATIRYRLPWVWITAGLVVAVGDAGARPKPRRLTLPIWVRVARCGAKRVHDSAWVAKQVATANGALAPFRLALRYREDTFAPATCDLLTRADRHAVARYAADEEVTILVMRRVRDVDLKSYNLMGVHWRYRGKRFPGRRYILLTGRARPLTLAHELAHYLGLPHDPAGGNMMTPGPSDPIWRKKGKTKPKPFSPRFSMRQGRRLRRAIRRILRRGRSRQRIGNQH